MKKIIILIVAILLLTGCEDETTVNGKNSPLSTYCDTEYGVEYIRDNGVYRGGITVRLDSDGNIIHCE